MRSSVGQCRNTRFRQLSASHVIITSVYTLRRLTDVYNCHDIRCRLMHAFRTGEFFFQPSDDKIIAALYLFSILARPSGARRYENWANKQTTILCKKKKKKKKNTSNK